MAPVVQVFPDAETLAHAAAGWLSGKAETSDGAFSIALSGGATPRRLYEILAGPAFAPTFPWDRVHWFWGDERFVAPDDDASNFRMVREAMLDPAKVPPANIHPIPTVGLTPHQAASQYENELRRFNKAAGQGRDRPLFDIVLLGLGEDGHTASLFPGDAALKERTAWTAAVVGVKAEPRITLTYPALASSRHVVFLVSGSAKRDMLAAVLDGEDRPATRVATGGRIRWMVDRAAVAGRADS